ncbi:AMP-binding protein [Mycobacterium attenuatum]|uniref:AMP-binding protein n=1 Tax=Mycobacterium attenuatum TaxID=2341086 RepID=UPI000F2420DD|nr:AMP-binding protein [Mycobacterium attenuatum]VBA62408.1 Salicylyl-CoA synthase / salicylate adenylyltransferase [Mycobacterium attenuatum]
MTLGEAVWEWTQRSGDKLAIADDTSSLTYLELARSADALAATLYSNGVRPGDRVMCQLPGTALGFAQYTPAYHTEVGATIADIEAHHAFLRTAVADSNISTELFENIQYIARLR